jgi:4-amino-4-deoxy-L-arabinose transferase-like glycosyltransferase
MRESIRNLNNNTSLNTEGILHTNRAAFLTILIILAMVGVALVLYSTTWGGGLISDSFQYIASAKNFASGQTLGYISEDGQIVPLTQYPPLFPIFLSLGELVGISPLEWARLINAGLFGINIIIISLSIKQITGSTGFSLLGALLAVCSARLIEVHSWVLSEPLYLCLSLVGFLTLARYLRKPKWIWLLLASFLTSLAFLTRYVGLALVVTALCVLAFRVTTSWRRRALEIFTFSIISVLPIILWTLRSLFLTSTFNNRTQGWVPLTAKNIVSAANTLITWFVPNVLVNGHEEAIMIAVVLVMGGLLILYALVLKKSPTNEKYLPYHNTSPYLYKIHTLYGFLYLAMIVVSKTEFDNNIGFTDRMLSPMLLSLVILLTSYLAALWSTNRLVTRTISGVMLAYLLIYFALGSVLTVPKLHQQGLGVARKSWHNSVTIQELQFLPPLPIYSNSPSSLYLWTNNPGHSIDEFELLTHQTKKEKAALVIFNHIPLTPRIQRLSQGLRVLVSDRIATIYVYEP